MQDFAAEAMKVSVKLAPAKSSGKPMIMAVNRTECQQRFAWPAVCQDEGMFTGHHAVGVPRTTELSGPLDTVVEGGYTWLCHECYLSTDEFATEACVRAKGFKGCFQDSNKDARRNELDGQQKSPGVNVPAVVAGAVVGGKQGNACKAGHESKHAGTIWLEGKGPFGKHG